MIQREITSHLVDLFGQYPFVTVTGPRQSGKTILCRDAFPHLEYVNLEAPDQREFVDSDPRGFLASLSGAAILDEIQNVPALLSYLQVMADESRSNGLFVLTGSEQFKLSDAISQSLAGRTALLRLLPFSLAERQSINASDSINDILYSGFYPRIHDQKLNPQQALGDYFETYVERDVRRLGEIRNLSGFRRFVQLCAGRVGQLLNLSSLGSDAGVSHTTAREWLTILETSYIVFQLQPSHINIRKRLVRSPKLYFYDVGLASYLMGIEYADQISTHPLRGTLFENMVVMEALKYRFNRGKQSNLSFFRDSRGLECDLLYETGHGLGAIEAKSGSTVASDYFHSLNQVAELIPDITTKVVVYGGASRQSRSDAEAVPISDLSEVLDRFETNQEISAFVRANKGPAPPKVDVHILDNAYRAHVKVLLDRLYVPCKQLADELFREVTQMSFIKFGMQEANSSTLFNAAKWEETKERYIVRSGVPFSDENRLSLEHRYTFTDYNGNGGNLGFNVVLSVFWRFGADMLSREVLVDGENFPALGSSVRYSELNGSHVRADHLVADISRRIMNRIRTLSRG